MALLVAPLLYLIWEVHFRAAFQYSTAVYPFDDADDWRYTACSRLVEHGYTLFQQVYSAQPPVLFLSLAEGMRFFGDSIVGARWVEILFGLASLAGSAWLAWTLAGPLAGGLAACVLAVSPAFLAYSHAIDAEGPMMALMTLSLALVAVSRERESLVWATAAGVMLALAILTKLFAVEAVLPAAWLLWSGSSERRERLRRLVAFGACVAIPVALEFGLVSPVQQWSQVITLHQQAATLHLSHTLPPLQILRDYYGLDLGLSLLALAGLLSLAATRRYAELGFVLLWVGGTTVMLFAFHPLFPHHPAILGTGVAVTAGIAVGRAMERPLLLRRPASITLLAGGLVYVALLPLLARHDRHLVVPGLRSSVPPLASFVREKVPSNSFVAVDDLSIADSAHRLVPPPLCDPSNVRLQAGYLTAADLITATRLYTPRLVLPSGVFLQVPAYLSWLHHHYHPIRAPYDLTGWQAY